MLPLGFGWSLWIHLFVQYPRVVSALLLVVGLSSTPVRLTGLEEGDHSVGREILCAIVNDAPPVGCLQGNPQEAGSARAPAAGR